MSFYGPAFAALSTGWYWVTDDPRYASDRDVVLSWWDAACDRVLLENVLRYGTFFTAFDKRICQEIKTAVGRDLSSDCSYYGYFLASRALQLPRAAAHWVADHEEHSDVVVTCSCCGDTLRLLDAHPDLLAELGVPPECCRSCNYILRRYGEFLDDELHASIREALRSQDEPRPCETCARSFKLRDCIFAYVHTGHGAVDLLFPNLYCSVCGICFVKSWGDYKRGGKALKVHRLREFIEFLEAPPPSDFRDLFYRYRDPASIREFLRLTSKLRTPQGYVEDFGSFFAALVAAGAYPEGSKRMSRGTLVVADDGTCASRLSNLRSTTSFTRRAFGTRRRSGTRSGSAEPTGWSKRRPALCMSSTSG